MPRVAVATCQTDGRFGLWSSARSEGRIPMNWGALLATNGYEVAVLGAPPPREDPCSIPSVSWSNPDDQTEYDWAVYSTTGRGRADWHGVSSIKRRMTVRIQWPTGQRGIDTYGCNVVAAPHPCVADQVAWEADLPRDRVAVLPSPALPLSWWCGVSGLPHPGAPVRDRVLWGAREPFGDRNGTSWRDYGEAGLAAFEHLASRGLKTSVLNARHLDPDYSPYAREAGARDRVARLGARLLSDVSLGDVQAEMLRSVLAIFLPPYCSPMLVESSVEGCAPLVCDQNRSLYPELVHAAEKHGVIVRQPGDVRSVIDRLVDDWGMRAAYVDDCKFGLTGNSPERCMDAWRDMERRFG